MKKSKIYKGVRVNSFGFPILNLNKKATNSKVTKRIFHSTFLSDLGESSPKNLIVMYDIPHEKKKERDWFRRHLKKFNYIMIQKSVWVGAVALAERILGLLEGNKDRG